MWLDRIESFVNARSDDTASWWPFAWLRPAKHEALTHARLAVLAVLYGLPVGIVAALAFVLAGATPFARLMPLALPMFFFVVGSGVVAPMWNRRAARLRR